MKRGKSRSLYLSIRRVIIQSAVITEAYHYVNYVKILSNFRLSKLTPYSEEIIGLCGFRRNKSNTDDKFCIRRIL
jgi:hypothetical protein